MSSSESVVDIQNTKKLALKKRILEYSINVKNFAKWFEISDVKRVEETYTAYKVVYRVTLNLK